MRFVRLSVGDFRAIRQLELEFGAGINVLHGPNDLGKSTVAEAIRAALLVPPSSALADTYTSWFSGVSPRVELTLVDGEGYWWRVKKTFGSASASSAEMFHSKDDATYTLDCRAREVEERLRELLGWGIPIPGGRGAPRGMPDSFIAQALLGGQDDADDILGRSLTGDLTDSGKLRLTKALASLAQNPLFKDVLLCAQGEVDQFFTATGQRKRGQGSRFTQAGERARAIGDELGQRKAQLQASSAIESEVASLRQRQASAQMALDEANTELRTTTERRERGAERELMVQRESEAKRRIEEIDAQRARLTLMERDVEQAGLGATACQAGLATAITAVETKEMERRSAEEAVRGAGGDEAVRQQELKKARLEKRAAELAGNFAMVASKASNVKLAIEARNLSLAATQVEASAVAEVTRAAADRERALEKERKGALELEASRALAAYVRWVGAAAARAESTKAQENALRVEAEASTKDKEASGIESLQAIAEQEFAAREAVLPVSELVEKVRELERELEKAEAALGGGVNVVVRPRRPIDVAVRVDGSPPTKESVVEPHTFAADRALGLEIDEVAGLEITVGSADARALVESLRRRWATEAVPALEKASAHNLAALVAATEALKLERLAAAATLRNAQQKRVEAKGLREQAALHRQRADAAPFGEDEVEARRVAIGDSDLAQLEARFIALKKPSDSRVEALHQGLTLAHSELQDERSRKEEQVRLAEFALAHARDRSREAEELRSLRVASLPTTDLDAQDVDLDEQVVAIKEEQASVATQIQNLGVESDRELERAKQVLDKAIAAHSEAKEAEKRARSALDQARERHSVLNGARGQFRASVDLLDRAAAATAWEAAKSALTSIPMESIAGADDLLKADARVAAALQQHAAIHEELMTREGALAHVGGAALREEVGRLEEARSVADSQQRALEIDADAWKLLRDTLRDVENEEGAHLGRALAGPVGARFAELTDGRYQDLRLDTALKTEGLGVSGASAEARTVLDALSVGTRSQLAALIRLTIADQLQSAIVLDDHLVHTDIARLGWFYEFLRKVAVNAQIIVITCRPQDYLSGFDVSADIAVTELAAGTLRTIDLGRILQRYVAPTL